MPTACLAKLSQLLQEQPERQALVTEAIRHLADAQAAFANCQQQAVGLRLYPGALLLGLLLRSPLRSTKWHSSSSSKEALTRLRQT
jgi:hypothetical protein